MRVESGDEAKSKEQLISEVRALRQALNERARPAAQDDPPSMDGLPCDFHLLADAMPQLVWTARPNGEVDYYNDRVGGFSGASYDVSTGTWQWAGILHPEDLERTRQAWQEAVERGTHYEIEHRVCLKDGSFRWFLSRAIPAVDASGQIARWFGTATDIHGTKCAAEELGTIEERLRMAKQVGKVGIWEWDPRAAAEHQWYWSPTLWKIYGREEGGRPDEAFQQSLHPADRERIQRRVADLLAGDLSELHEEFRIIRPDGMVRWIEGTARVHRDEDGAPLRVTGANLDVTDRKTAEVQLRSSEERYRTLFDSIDEGFALIEVIFDHQQRAVDYRFLEINPAFARHTGFTDALGKRITELVPAINESWFEIYGKVALTGEAVRFEEAAPAMGRVFDVYAFRTGDSAERKIAVLFTDVTVRRGEQEQLRQKAQELEQLNEALRVAKEEAESANRAKDRFLAVLSHELRTPLAPVLLTASVLEKDPALPAEFREPIAMIRRNVTIEARLIDDLLDVSRVLSGKLRLNEQPVEVDTVVRYALETCAEDIQNRRLDLTVELAAAGAYVCGDPARLQQVFWNLLKNAIKFTPEGGRLEVASRHMGDLVCVSVADSGIGIRPDALGRIFDAFEQADQEVTRKFGGLGLGLAISKSIMDMHGGSITARSEGVGQGAKFTVELAATAPPPAEAAAQRAGLEAAMRPAAGLRILLVEDHQDTARVLAKLLATRGFQLTVAHSVAQALELAGRNRFDLVVSDVGLPDGTGFELMQVLYERYQLTGIAMSGYGMDDDVRKGREAGFLEHIVKPVDLAHLVQAIQRHTR